MALSVFFYFIFYFTRFVFTIFFLNIYILLLLIAAKEQTRSRYPFFFFFFFSCFLCPILQLIRKRNDDVCVLQKGMTSRQEMLAFPHKDGMVSYLQHGWNGWDSPGSVDEADVEVIFERTNQTTVAVVVR